MLPQTTIWKGVLMWTELQYNRARMRLPAVLLSLVLSAAAQTTEPARTPAVRETPPDLKAYSEASRIGDPQEKIEALEKFMHDFPHSARVRSADYSIS